MKSKNGSRGLYESRKRHGARAVAHPSYDSCPCLQGREHALRRHRILPHPHPGGVEEGVGDRTGGGAHHDHAPVPPPGRTATPRWRTTLRTQRVVVNSTRPVAVNIASALIWNKDKWR